MGTFVDSGASRDCSVSDVGTGSAPSTADNASVSPTPSAGRLALTESLPDGRGGAPPRGVSGCRSTPRSGSSSLGSCSPSSPIPARCRPTRTSRWGSGPAGAGLPEPLVPPGRRHRRGSSASRRPRQALRSRPRSSDGPSNPRSGAPHPCGPGDPVGTCGPSSCRAGGRDHDPIGGGRHRLRHGGEPGVRAGDHPRGRSRGRPRVVPRAR